MRGLEAILLLQVTVKVPRRLLQWRAVYFAPVIPSTWPPITTRRLGSACQHHHLRVLRINDALSLYPCYLHIQVEHDYAGHSRRPPHLPFVQRLAYTRRVHELAGFHVHPPSHTHISINLVSLESLTCLESENKCQHRKKLNSKGVNGVFVDLPYEFVKEPNFPQSENCGTDVVVISNDRARQSK